MKIDKKMIDIGEEVFYSKKLMDALESHMPILRTHPDTIHHSIKIGAAAPYEGDLYGYLTSVNIAQKMHWVIMRTNGLNSSIEFDTKVHRTLLIPSEGYVNNVKQLIKTKPGTIGL